MHPLLFNIGSLPIHTYGFLIAIGFLCAVLVIRKLCMMSGLDVEKTLDFTFWLLLVGFIGARILFIITKWDSFMENPSDMYRVWEGGLVFLGGPIACVPFAYWYMKRNRLPFWRTGDVLIPGLTINHMWGRFGCLSAGCCYGKPTGTSYGIKLYSDLVDRDLQGINLHPTQLYEAGSLFILFLGLLWVFKHKKFDGQVVLTYFIAYPIIRSIIEIFRGDLIRGFVIDGILSTSQFLSLIIFVVASCVLMWRLKVVHQESRA
jgi:phosphatidylglycerol:prolipoprotein diacylglycerol transferase